MSAGTLGLAQEASLANRPNMRAGYTSISSGAIHQLVAAIAAEAFNVPLRNVRAGVHDEQGQVSVSLAVPLVLRALPGQPGRPGLPGTAAFPKDDGGTVLERAASARAVVASRIQALAGATVGRVDIRFTGIREGAQTNGGRVQ